LNWTKVEIKKIVGVKQKTKVFVVHNIVALEGGEQLVYPAVVISKKRLFKPYVFLKASAVSHANKIYPDHLKYHQICYSYGLSHKIYFDHNWTSYYFMRFASGGDLISYLDKSGPISYKEQLDLSEQLILLVKKLHDLEIAHRDIKPQNILVDYYQDGKPQLYLTDFGFATRDEKSKKRPGTPIYKPVEYITHHNFDTKKGDLFCVGLTIFSICSNADFYFVLLKKIREERESGWDKISPDQLYLDFFRRYKDQLIEESMVASPVCLKQIVKSLLDEFSQRRMELRCALEMIAFEQAQVC
jgi:serine/threonine protein kinase